MIRKGLAGVSITVLFILAFGHAPQTSAPIKLARHPDYHAGKIVFSYLGDIWIANEDGSSPQRVSDHRGHDMYPRFSPDGKWIAFSSNRYGNNDVFVLPAPGGRGASAADLLHWQRRSRRLDARFAAGVVPRRARRRRVSQRRDAVRGVRQRWSGAAAAGGLGLLRQLLAGWKAARVQPSSCRVDAAALPRPLPRRPLE